MTMESLIDLLQWPAMLVTLIAAWLVGSRHRVRRCAGFLCFILSNVLWVIWGWHSQAWALIVLQLGLFAMNLRGTRKNAAPPLETRDEPEKGRVSGLFAELPNKPTHTRIYFEQSPARSNI